VPARLGSCLDTLEPGGVSLYSVDESLRENLVRRGVCARHRPLSRNVERRQRVDQARPAEGFAQSGWGIRQVRVTVVPLTLRSAKAPPGGVAVLVRLLWLTSLREGCSELANCCSVAPSRSCTRPLKPPGRRDPGRFSFWSTVAFSAGLLWWACGGCRKAVSVVWTLVVVVVAT
jgi:hypothetical protein